MATPTTGGNLPDIFAAIMELAGSEPGTIDEANETLYAIEDEAAAALRLPG